METSPAMHHAQPIPPAVARAFHVDAAGRSTNSHTVFTTRDAGQAHQLVQQHYCEHNLVPLTTAPLSVRMDAAAVGGLHLSRLQYGAKVDIEPAHHKAFWLISTTLSGHGDIRVGDRNFQVSTGDTVFHAPDRSNRMRFEAADSQLNVLISRAKIERFFFNWCGAAPPTNLYFEPVLSGLQPHAAEYHNLLAMLMARAATSLPSDGLLLREWDERLEDTLYAFILLRCEHTATRTLAGANDRGLPPHVRRAEAFIRANVGEALSLSRIASESGVSIRSLTAGFHAHLGTSPMKLLKLLRLEKAHDELRAARDVHPRPSVASIASRWGYQHMSQFAADYKRSFGVSPSATLNCKP